jgi:hypothetical protein
MARNSYKRKETQVFAFISYVGNRKCFSLSFSPPPPFVYTLYCYNKIEGRKEGRKEGKKEGRKEENKGGKEIFSSFCYAFSVKMTHDSLFSNTKVRLIYKYIEMCYTSCVMLVKCIN